MLAEQKIEIAGPAGVLEARYRPSEQSQVGLIVCHPHPLFQGTMNNKVVTTTERAAAELGYPTLRFNFRGVGASQGTHDYGVGEQEDVLSVIRYVTKRLGWQKVILAGFSFGSGMACLAACQVPSLVKTLILLAPPVHHFDAPSTLPFEFDTHIMMGDADEVVPFDEVEHWAQLAVPTPSFVVFEAASHFFHGRLIELKEAVQQALCAKV